MKSILTTFAIFLAATALPADTSSSSSVTTEAQILDLAPGITAIITRGEGSVLELYADGHPVVRLEDHRFLPATDDPDLADPWSDMPAPIDLNADGILEWAVWGYSGGAHCCATLHIFSLGNPPRLLSSTDLRDSDPTAFCDLDADGLFEIEARDWSFAYWNASFADSPAPAIILTLFPPYSFLIPRGVSRSTGLQLNPSLMARPAPSATEWQTWLAEIPATFEPANPPPQIWRHMLNLIYTGHPGLADEFLDAAWPGKSPEKEAFHAAFREQLHASPWYRQLIR